MNPPAHPDAPLPLEGALFGVPDAPVELVQTHIGWVYLAGQYAFKFKKKVKFDFLDFTTLEGRRWACQREIDLNRRLCHDLYLGLLPLYRFEDGSVRLDLNLKLGTGAPRSRKGELIDWAIWMHRLPRERMLDRLLAGTELTPAHIEAIADLLADFHMKQRGKNPPGGLGDLDAVAGNVDENMREGRTLDRLVLAEGAWRFLDKRSRDFLTGHGEIIRRRAREGFVTDGHGDLRAENICLPENMPPVLFDCIEFNDRFRVADGAMDMAFLAMDLASRGRDDLSRVFLARYTQRCDRNLPIKLLNFYLGYRAYVKGKVAAWIMADKNVGTEQRVYATHQSRALFDLAIHYALQDQPVLLVFCGPAGSGKSTLATRLAERLKCEHHSTDLIRDTLIPRGEPPDKRYAPEISARVYDNLFERAAAALAANRTVILDGTFSTKSVRTKAAKISPSPLPLRERAEAHPFAPGVRGESPDYPKKPIATILIWAHCPPDAHRAHIAERTRVGDTYGSEATAEISERQQRTFEPPEPGEGFDAICKIDTAGDPETSSAATWNAVLNALADANK